MLGGCLVPSQISGEGGDETSPSRSEFNALKRRLENLEKILGISVAFNGEADKQESGRREGAPPFKIDI